MKVVQTRIKTSLEKLERKYTSKSQIKIRISPDAPEVIRRDVVSAMDEKYFPDYKEQIKNYYRSLAENSD